MNRSHHSNWRCTLCMMKRRSPMWFACALLKRRSCCHSPILLRSRRMRGAPTPVVPLSRGLARGRSPTGGRGSPSPRCHDPAGPPYCSSIGGIGGPSRPPCHSPTRRKGMPCLRRLLIAIDFDCLRVLFVVWFSKLNYLLIADRCQLHVGKGNFLCHTSIFNNLYFNY
jgi:hypothetical protein